MKKRKFRYSLSGTVLFAFLFVIAVMLVGASAIGYTVFTDITTQQFEDSAYYTANTLAQLIDADSLTGYLASGEKDEEYLSTEQVLQTIVDTDGCAVIYVAEVDTENMERHYIYDVVSEESGLEQYPLGFVNSISDDFLKNYQAVLNKEAENSSVFSHADTLGDYVTVMAPVYNSSGDLVAVCGVIKTLDLITSGRSQFLRQLLIWAVILAVISGTAHLLFMRYRIVIPLQKIGAETERFTSQKQADTSHLAQDLRSSSEIGDLALAIDTMEETIVTNVRNLVQITAEKNRIGAELDIAKNIQSNALPKICETFPGRPEIDVCAVMDPAREVGGDFYDCFFLDKDRFCMVIADVSDKGIPAALFMMNSKVLLKTAAMSCDDPAEILSRVNRSLCENNESGMFVTVWLGILDLNTGLIRAANAGHEYPIIRSGDGSPYELLKDRHGFVLGGFEASRYKEYTIRLHPGGRLFLYTDGLSEASDPDNNQFGTDRILESLNASPEETSEDQVSRIFADVDTFVSGAAQFDDTTVLALRYIGPQTETDENELTVPAVTDSITAVTEFTEKKLDAMNGTPKASMQLAVIIDELLGNIVHYAYPNKEGNVTFRFEAVSDDEVQLTFIDTGIPFNPLEKEAPDITASAEEREIGGLGVFMAKKLSDSIEYRYENEQNILTVRKNIRC